MFAWAVAVSDLFIRRPVHFLLSSFIIIQVWHLCLFNLLVAFMQYLPENLQYFDDHLFRKCQYRVPSISCPRPLFENRRLPLRGVSFSKHWLPHYLTYVLVWQHTSHHSTFVLFRPKVHYPICLQSETFLPPQVWSVWSNLVLNMTKCLNLSRRGNMLDILSYNF